MPESPQENQKEPKSNTFSSSNYFNNQTELSIVEFQKEPDIEKKKQIFLDSIQPAFSKLIENIIFVYNFHIIGNLDLLKNDCLSFLFENIYKFDSTKGHKAFSYFNVIAKNWFIQKVKTLKKSSKVNVEFDSDVIENLEKNNHEAVVFFYEDSLFKEEFLELLKEEVEKWRDKFNKSQEQKILEAIILLLNNPDLVSIYNKKAVYLYLREISGMNTKQVVTNLMKFKKKYLLFKKRYHDGDV